jgi:glucose-1-phosphate thymidylyltransferase
VLLSSTTFLILTWNFPTESFINVHLSTVSGGSMEIIIPMAGSGTRLRPHTFSKPKPLMHVAGKPMLGHILDRLKPLKADKIHFVIGGFENMVKEYIASYKMNNFLVVQDSPQGDGGAIFLAKPNVNPESDVLVVFSDTIFETDFAVISKAKKSNQNIIWVKEVEDPRRFGVVFVKDGIITKLIEKPQEPVSKLAVVGMYYIRKAKIMFDCLEELQKKNIQNKGEFRLIDALDLMLKKGETIIPAPIQKWMDCGTPETILETNRELLKSNHKIVKTINSVIREPVYIEDGAVVSNSILGPNVSIGAGTKIESSIIKESIIETDAKITNAQICFSLIGQKALVEGVFEQVNVGDNSQLTTVDKEK